MVNFDQMLHAHACQHCLTTGMRISLYFGDRASLSISPADPGFIVKMRITLEPHCILWIKFCISILFQNCSATGMQNGDEASIRLVDSKCS